MRITFLLPPLSLSGGIKAARRIADGLVERGHEVSLISVEREEAWPPPWRPRRFTRRIRAELHKRTSPPHDGFMAGSKAHVVVLPTATHAARDVPDADVVIATWWETAESMRDFPASKGRKFYFVQADETNLSGPGARDRVIRTYRDPFKHICVSNFVAQLIGEYGHASAAVVHIGVDDIFFERRRERERGRPPVIGALHNIHPMKGWSVAMRAIEAVRERVPGTRVATFGAWPMERDHMMDDMTFEVRPTQSRIVELSASVDVWLLPSAREGFGLPPIEAAATGTPIVSTRCGGPLDYVVDGENGYLVDVDDAAGMADALTRVLTCEPAAWKAMSDAAARIAERFRWTTTVEAFERALTQS